MTIRLGLKHDFLFPSQICQLSRKREAGRPFRLKQTLYIYIYIYIYKYIYVYTHTLTCIYLYVDPGNKSCKSTPKCAVARVFSSFTTVRHRVLTKNTQVEKYDESVDSKVEVSECVHMEHDRSSVLRQKRHVRRPAARRV